MNNMNDQSLLQEIEDDLARQKAEKFWKQYGNLIIAAAFAVVLATAAFSMYKNFRLTQAQSTTAAFVDVFDDYKEKDPAFSKALDDYAKDNGANALGVLAKFQKAALAVANDERPKALETYNALASDASVEAKFRQLADLLYVQTDMDTGEVPALEARLKPLMDGSPWRFTAREFAGYLAIRSGDKEKAKQIFTELRSLPEVPKSIEARSRDILNWLKGA